MLTSSLSVAFADAGVPWFGNMSGECAMLPYLETYCSLTRFAPRSGFAERLAGKTFSLANGMGSRNQAISAMEFRLLLWSHRRSGKSIIHLLRSEEHVAFMYRNMLKSHNVVATVHLPLALWTESYIESLSKCSGLISYFSSGAQKLQELLPGKEIVFIHDGVETSFFRPAPYDHSSPRLLFAGVYLRNVEMLARVVPRIMKKWPNVQVDLLVPVKRRDGKAFKYLARLPKVTFHAGLADAQLLQLYQSAYLLILPMDDSGANTSILEAMSCGVPVVTTDVGGIRDYGGGHIFQVCANNHDDDFVEIVEAYMGSNTLRDTIGRASRQFCEETLSWRLIAAKHYDFYSRIATVK